MKKHYKLFHSDPLNSLFGQKNKLQIEVSAFDAQKQLSAT